MGERLPSNKKGLQPFLALVGLRRPFSAAKPCASLVFDCALHGFQPFPALVGLRAIFVPGASHLYAGLRGKGCGTRVRDTPGRRQCLLHLPFFDILSVARPPKAFIRTSPDGAVPRKNPHGDVPKRFQTFHCEVEHWFQSGTFETNGDGMVLAFVCLRMFFV